MKQSLMFLSLQKSSNEHLDLPNNYKKISKDNKSWAIKYTGKVLHFAFWYIGYQMTEWFFWHNFLLLDLLNLWNIHRFFFVAIKKNGPIWLLE